MDGNLSTELDVKLFMETLPVKEQNLVFQLINQQIPRSLSKSHRIDSTYQIVKHAETSPVSFSEIYDYLCTSCNLKFIGMYAKDRDLAHHYFLANGFMGIISVETAWFSSHDHSEKQWINIHHVGCVCELYRVKRDSKLIHIQGETICDINKLSDEYLDILSLYHALLSRASVIGYTKLWAKNVLLQRFNILVNQYANNLSWRLYSYLLSNARILGIDINGEREFIGKTGGVLKYNELCPRIPTLLTRIRDKLNLLD